MSVHFTTGLVCLTVLSACSPRHRDHVVHVANDDSAMTAAIRHSRHTVDEVISALQATPPKRLSAVKVRLAEGDKVEFVWLSQPVYRDACWRLRCPTTSARLFPSISRLTRPR